MKSADVRQSFLDFFKSKGHTIVPSSSLMPDSPNLLFTNAGMNQFVPIFLGQTKCPYTPARAADTQKCIRAGGKHNDLEDVGLDTYHHTFFEMLGNWSFGDYFKKEAIQWAWELVTEVWKFPKERLYATVYKPGPGDPAAFDQEAYDFWAEQFARAGLDPAVHIVFGNKKDNFWMMGETGPCGPCSELHVDLTPAGDTKGSLVNVGSPLCMEIWNLVFIQFNANADGSFTNLPAQHVDTGAGFERISGIIQCSKNFTDFSGVISNYETDVFRPIFDEIEKLSGKKYTSTLPKSGSTGDTEQEKIDVAFRVIADHIRTLSFSIADGILPGNNDRNYVLRRILRRAVKYGRTLELHEPFFYKLVEPLATHMGGVFPELTAKKDKVKDTIKQEEESFNRTLDKGIEMFNAESARIQGFADGKGMGDGSGYGMGSGDGAGYGDGSGDCGGSGSARVSRAPEDVSSDGIEAEGARYSKRHLPHFEKPWAIYAVAFSTIKRRVLSDQEKQIVLDALKHLNGIKYELFAACVMPDHVHVLFQPIIKETNQSGEPIFYSLTEIMHSIKSFTAHEINRVSGQEGSVWEKESFDRYIRSDRDLQEKFLYIVENPWKSGVVGRQEDYPWIWSHLSCHSQAGTPSNARGDACAPQQAVDAVFSGELAFKLYDTYGFPLDLTELMAREKGLTVDTVGFEILMEQQRARARAAQKKEIIEVTEAQVGGKTEFHGFDHTEIEATVLAVQDLKGKQAVITDKTVFYAEMGGQVGDTGFIGAAKVANTIKAGETFLHILAPEQIAPGIGEVVILKIDKDRRGMIEGHHSGTHLFHWALHEVVSNEATQKGSSVGPDRLRFDFNSAPVTPEQIARIEGLVNEKITARQKVQWSERPYDEVKGDATVMQMFGEKYGDTVRVVDIGGYSRELCGGTHVRTTTEIGYFKVISEGAVAAGIRRIEAVAGAAAEEYFIKKLEESFSKLSELKSKLDEAGIEPPDLPDGQATGAEQLSNLHGKISGLITEMEEQLAAHEKTRAKEQERQAQIEGVQLAEQLTPKVTQLGGMDCIIEQVSATSPDVLKFAIDAIKAKISGIIILASNCNGKANVICSVHSSLTKKIQAGHVIKKIAPIMGGGGGGKPELAQAGGKNPEKIDDALEEARKLLAQ